MDSICARGDPGVIDYRILRIRGSHDNIGAAHGFLGGRNRTSLVGRGESLAFFLAAAPDPNILQLAHAADSVNLRLRLKPAADYSHDRRAGRSQKIRGIAGCGAGADLPEEIGFKLRQWPRRLPVEQKEKEMRSILRIGGIEFGPEVVTIHSAEAVQRRASI